MQNEGIAKGDLLKSIVKQISRLSIPLWRCGEGYIGEGGSLCAGDDDTLPYVGSLLHFLPKQEMKAAGRHQ